MEAQVILLKHAYPILIENVNPKEWKLGNEGKLQAIKIAEHLRPQDIRHILSSYEPKALETATLVGKAIGIEPVIVDGLQEFDISPRPIMTRDQHAEANRKIFDFPDQPMLGKESASSARARFASALIGALIKIPRSENVLVVTHGTVISLFVGHQDFEKSFSIWKKLACISYVRLSRQDLVLKEIVEDPLR